MGASRHRFARRGGGFESLPLHRAKDLPRNQRLGIAASWILNERNMTPPVPRQSFHGRFTQGQSAERRETPVGTPASFRLEAD
jgi:hypothetical protein